MNTKRKNDWIWIAIVISVLIMIWNLPVEAQTQVEKNNARKAARLAPQKAPAATTTTRGYIAPSNSLNPTLQHDGGYINLRTRTTPAGTETTGYVNGRYIRIVEKKDG